MKINKVLILFLMFGLFVGTGESLALTSRVLIIQDNAPWGISAHQTILTRHGISYTEITSAQIAATVLSPYEMIIMPSQQSDTTYNNWNSNIAKIEAYVQNGGKLWQSTSYARLEPLIPGGVISSIDNDSFNVITFSSHPWVKGVPSPMQGSLASEESFTNLYAGSLVIATAQTSGNPVLVDFRYGAGRVLITGQTLEFAWDYNWDGKPILENSLIDMLGDRVLIVQDNAPWGISAHQTILTRHGISYTEITSAQIAATGLSPYEMIIMPSQQSDTTYNNWNSNIAKIEAYVQNGGKLWQSTSYASLEPLIPGGVISSIDNDIFNVITFSSHPWVKGVPSPMQGWLASEESFTNLYAGSLVIATAQTSGNPVLVDFRYGAGRVLITGQTLEFAWDTNWDGKPILENSLIDMLGDRVLIVQDNYPWSTGIQDILLLHKIPFNQTTSTHMATVGLSQYEVVIIPNNQTDSFNTAWNTNRPRFESFVNNGGKLWHGLITFGAVSPIGVGGVASHFESEKVNLAVALGHRWLKGVPSIMNGTAASHASFTGLYPGSTIVAKAQASDQPTLVDYMYGSGRVLITGQTLTYAYTFDQDVKPILKNSLLNLINGAGFPWCQFLPAILKNAKP